MSIPASHLKRSELAHDSTSEDLASRSEFISTNLVECDVIHDRISSRLGASLEGATLDIHMQGLGT